MLNFARESQDEIVVPMASLIEYFGSYFMVYALEPLDLDTLVYGSITQDLVIKNDLNELVTVEKLSSYFNCSFHMVLERGTMNEKEMFLSSGMEIHRMEGQLFLTDIERMAPLEIGHADTEKSCFVHFINFIPLNMIL